MSLERSFDTYTATAVRGERPVPACSRALDSHPAAHANPARHTTAATGRNVIRLTPYLMVYVAAGRRLLTVCTSRSAFCILPEYPPLILARVNDERRDPGGEDHGEEERCRHRPQHGQELRAAERVDVVVRRRLAVGETRPFPRRQAEGDR